MPWTGKRQNGLAAKFHLGWPVNGSVVHSIPLEAPQAPGGRPLGPGDSLNVTLFCKGWIYIYMWESGLKGKKHGWFQSWYTTDFPSPAPMNGKVV